VFSFWVGQYLREAFKPCPCFFDRAVSVWDRLIPSTPPPELFAAFLHLEAEICVGHYSVSAARLNKLAGRVAITA